VVVGPTTTDQCGQNPAEGLHIVQRVKNKVNAVNSWIDIGEGCPPQQNIYAALCVLHLLCSESNSYCLLSFHESLHECIHEILPARCLLSRHIALVLCQHISIRLCAVLKGVEPTRRW